MLKKYFIVGGAGFIGSHLSKKLLQEADVFVRIYDNFSSGKMFHLEEIVGNPNFDIVKADVKELQQLTDSMKGSDVVFHFASNPDISKAIKQPDIDFWEGTYLTNNVIEAMRINKVKNLIYASGSGVYGDIGYIETAEDYSPLLPISTYGASKLACEALISSYCFMFDINAAAFRFANVVGPHQTHGVGYDFIRKLLDDKNQLEILGDGSQSKSYIYVYDIIDALQTVEGNYLKGYSYYNVATEDYITVNEIADIVINIMNLKNVKFKHTGGDRGWKGDVPIVRLNSEKIRKLGWKNRFNAYQAINESVKSMYQDALLNKFGWKGEVK
ncbi:MAG TPA: NAD-dependent epimerase/dehydratase family protein [Ignavibacteria bacterium]